MGNRSNEESKVYSAIYSSAVLINEKYRHEFGNKIFCNQHLAFIKQYFSYDVDHKSNIFETLKAHFKNNINLINLDYNVDVKFNGYIVSSCKEGKKYSTTYSTKNFQTYMFSLFCRFLYSKDSELTKENLAKMNLTPEFIINFKASYFKTKVSESIGNKRVVINSDNDLRAIKEKKHKQHKKKVKDKASKNNDKKANNYDEDDYAFLDEVIKDTKKDGVDKLISFASRVISDYLGEFKNYTIEEQVLVEDVYKFFKDIQLSHELYIAFTSKADNFNYKDASDSINVYLSRLMVKDIDKKYKLIFLPFAMYPVIKYLDVNYHGFIDYGIVISLSLHVVLLNDLLQNNAFRKEIKTFSDLYEGAEVLFRYIYTPDDNILNPKKIIDFTSMNLKKIQSFDNICDFVIKQYAFSLKIYLPNTLRLYRINNIRKDEFVTKNIDLIQSYIKNIDKVCMIFTNSTKKDIENDDISLNTTLEERGAGGSIDYFE